MGIVYLFDDFSYLFRGKIGMVAAVLLQLITKLHDTPLLVRGKIGQKCRVLPLRGVVDTVTSPAGRMATLQFRIDLIGSESNQMKHLVG